MLGRAAVLWLPGAQLGAVQDVVAEVAEAVEAGPERRDVLRVSPFWKHRSVSSRAEQHGTWNGWLQGSVIALQADTSGDHRQGVRGSSLTDVAHRLVCCYEFK